MLNKLILAFQLVKNMGLSYVFYRSWHEILKRTPLFAKKFPLASQKQTIPSLDSWLAKSHFFFKNKKELETKIQLSDSQKTTLETHAKRIFAGDVLFFNAEWKSLGLDFDWISNPDTGHKYKLLPWYKIADLSLETGDIKFVWEKSRFSFLHTLFRYDLHLEKDSSEFVFSQIEDWITKNPVNQGPNWKCSQEISLRIINWTYALFFYSDSKNLTEERFQKIVQSIYDQFYHVYKNINFSRKTVRNNHAITECFALYFCGTLFPFFTNAHTIKTKGKSWFEEEIAYQIYEDGTFLQFSMNYHRVVIQLLTLAIPFAEKNNDSFRAVVKKRALNSVKFLYQCCQLENGHLPNYGANDGALFFPFNSCEYRDYRGQLNSLYVILTNKSLFEDNYLLEDALWVGSFKNVSFQPLQQEKTAHFDKGGYYLMRDDLFFMFIRCGKHKDRPSQADNLHIDFWIGSENVLRDSGSYKYNTTPDNIAYFNASKGHNSVSLGNHDQMLKGGRFIWYYWTQAIFGNIEETPEKLIFRGKVSAFRQLSSKIVHEREIVWDKTLKKLQITDKIKAKPNDLPINQHFNLPNHYQNLISISPELSTQEGWYSTYYGIKEKSISLVNSSKENSISTTFSCKK